MESGMPRQPAQNLEARTLCIRAKEHDWRLFPKQFCISSISTICAVTGPSIVKTLSDKSDGVLKVASQKVSLTLQLSIGMAQISYSYGHIIFRLSCTDLRGAGQQDCSCMHIIPSSTV